MNRYLKRLSNFLKPYQKKEVLRRILLENEFNTEEEKKELWSKLEVMKDDEIEKAWLSVINNLKGD